MAEGEHLAMLSQGIETWNLWRKASRTTQADLSGASLQGKFLHHIDLYKVNLAQADLSTAHLIGADFRKADLQRANLTYADLLDADFEGANLEGAHLNLAGCQNANFSGANLRRAQLQGANLARAQLVETNLESADLSGCLVYGTSVWNVQLEGARQIGLAISRLGEPRITLDNIEVAQFIHLMLKNQKIRQVIDTITSKVVLILGCFTPERRAVLDALRDELRVRNYSPVVFDFDGPTSRDLTETVSTLAHMARFIIADLTEAKSIPHELSVIVPHLPSVAVQPLLQQGDSGYSMFEHWQRYPWVLPPYVYEDQKALLDSLTSNVIAPAEAKVENLRSRR